MVGRAFCVCLEGTILRWCLRRGVACNDLWGIDESWKRVGGGNEGQEGGKRSKGDGVKGGGWEGRGWGRGGSVEEASGMGCGEEREGRGDVEGGS